MAERKSTVPAGVEPLGPLAKQVPQSFYFPLLFWVCLIAGLVLFCFIFALAGGLVQPARPEEAFQQFQLMFPLIAGPLGALFFGGLGYYCWLQTRKRVWVSPVGFAWVTPGRCELFPWDRVTKVKFPLKIEREDGYKVDLSKHLDGMDSALPFDEFWVPVKLAKVREQLDRGEAVKFGVYTVSRDGVSKGGDVVPWKYLDRIVRVTGQVNGLQLYMTGKTLPWSMVGLNSVTNHLVLQRLVAEMVNESRTRGA